MARLAVLVVAAVTVNGGRGGPDHLADLARFSA